MGELERDLVAIAISLVLLTSAWHGLFAARDWHQLADSHAHPPAAPIELIRLPR
jgi:hypothetical protein